MGYQLRDSKTKEILERHETSFWDFLQTRYGGMFPVRMPGESVPRPYRYFGVSREDAFWEPTPDEDYLTESSISYNSLGVVSMPTERDYVKTLVDRLTDEQIHALAVILESMAWPTESLSPDETAELEQARAEIKAGKGIKAKNVWDELGI